MGLEKDEFSQGLEPVGVILVPEQVVRVPTARSEPLGRCYLELTSFSSPSCSNLSLSSGARQSRMSWDYPNPTSAAEGEGEATLGFSFGRAPGQPKTPIPAFSPSFSRAMPGSRWHLQEEVSRKGGKARPWI